MLSTILVDILYILIMGVLTLSIKYGVPWFTAKVYGIKSDALRDFIEDAMCYAENKYAKSTGTQKFNYVFNTANEWCKSHNVNVSEDELKVMIESVFTVLDSVHYVNKDKED